MTELPILLRLKDGTVCKFRKRGAHWEGDSFDRRGWMPVEGDHGSEWMDAALDEIQRLAEERNRTRLAR